MSKRYTYPAIIYLLFCVLMSPVLFAQKPNFKFRSVLESDGLINSTVLEIFEDSHGFIWLGTHHGLQRFDGKSFTNYQNSSDTSGLSHNFINGFCEDNDGNIWIGTSLGLNTYIREKDIIERYKWNKHFAGKFDDISVVRILSDDTDKNIIWFTANDIGLIKLNILSDSATVFPLEFSGGWDTWAQGLMQHPYQKDKLIIGDASLLIFHKSTGKLEEILSLEQTSDIPNNKINDMVIDPNDSTLLWCATGDLWGRGSLGGLLKYNLETGQYHLFSKENRKGEIPDVHILQVCFSDNNKLWVGTRNHGVVLYDLTTDKFFQYVYNEFDEGSFVTENAIRSMFLDQSGTMWFGTWGDGMSILSPALQKFQHYKHFPGAENSLADNYITGISEDKFGNIWIGTKAGGMSKYDPAHKTFENHFQEFSKNGSNPNEITYVFYDSHDNLWIGTYADALYRYRPETGEKIHYRKGSAAREVSQKRISAISELTPGEILISTYGGGLNIYSYETDKFQKYLHNPADSTTIADNQIWLPFLGHDGNYYFGGNSIAGFIQFNPITKKFGIPITDRPFTTYIDAINTADGRIYIDAISLGLVEVIVRDTISVILQTDSLGNGIRNVESISLDKSHMIWMGTSNGLVKFDPQQKVFTRYDVDDGLQDYRFIRFAGFCSSAGELYFGGINGINIFHPDEIKLSSFQPPVVFTDFKLFQESVVIEDESPLKKNILLTEELELTYNQNDFSISFAALDYSNPHKIKYKYKLVNHDNEWIQIGSSAVANYTNMDPGTYTFQVVSTNADGVWSNQIKKLEVTIHPPWWQTITAYIIYGLLFILGFIIVDRFQRKRLKEKTRARVREKELTQAKAIEKAYTKLKNTQTQLIHSEKMASLGELTAGIAHEIQNPLNFVNNFSDVSVDLLEEMNEEIDQGNTLEVKSIANDLKQNLEKIHHHGERASSIVKGMLEHSRAGNDKKQPTDINAMADEYIRLAYHGIRAKDKSFNADFKTDLDEDLPKINVVGQDIARVVLNLINNAFFAVAAKASDTTNTNYKPRVTISTKKINGQVEISVKDNGMGIPENILDKIFQPFFTTKASGEGTGLGLSLSYDIVTKGHGGEIKIETKENEGTEFVIHLPINPNK